MGEYGHIRIVKQDSRFTLGMLSEGFSQKLLVMLKERPEMGLATPR